jgi:hypothetical protein
VTEKTNMTAVEEIRRAAALMRERAQTALPGPWRSFTKYIAAPVGGCTCGGPFPDGTAHEPHCGLEPFAEADPATAAHVASWHPEVALAVADWLDDAAQSVEHGPHFPSTEQRWARPLAVARAYLSGE